MNDLKAWIIYGPPGSGKSTEAKRLGSSMDNVTHLERDMLREKIHGALKWSEHRFNPRDEYIVDALWKHIIVHKNPRLIISDTLCKKRDRDNLIALLEWLGYDVQVVRMNTSLEECIRRDAARGDRTVGVEVINRMWEKFNEHN